MALNGLITTSEAARIIGTSTRTVLRMVDAGKLVPRERLATGRGVYLFDRADIQKIARQYQAPARAAALREAADALRAGEGPFEESDAAIAFWLDDRADTIDKEAHKEDS